VNHQAQPQTASAASGGLAVHRDEILAGLAAAQKQVSPQFLYDERGSEIFELITTLEEYYPTRTEIGLLEKHGREIAQLAGARAAVIELGAGSSRKARLLLAALENPVAYVPIDISAAYLARQAAEVSRAFPRVTVAPLVADFTQPFELSVPPRARRTLLFFPGSTIGNLARRRALELLGRLAALPRPRALLIGIDVCDDPGALHRAYNDARGLTAAFNLNLLSRFNRELDANFDVNAFEHEAPYDEREARIEMRLVSRQRQTATLAGTPLAFDAGEYIVTEHSHKYSPEEFSSMAALAGWHGVACWIDPDRRFSLHYLE
jgi:dimethylhistidine N-methyltransferase